MTTYFPPKVNTAYVFFLSLTDSANRPASKANPTLAAGDFKVSIDGGAQANLATLPSVAPAAGRAVQVSLSSGEMNGANIVIDCHDADGEWDDVLVLLQTTTRQIDDLAFPATSGRSMVVDLNGLVDATMVKVGASGAGVAQTGGDIYPAVTNIAVTSAALNQTAASRTITTGSGAGGVGNTTAADGVYDNLSDAAGTLDFYYQFDISGTVGAVAVGAEWLGYLVGVLNTVKVYAYNWGGASWDQIGTIIGIAGAINATNDFELTSAHTSAGLVRIRFQATGLTTATLKTDRILVGYAVVALAASAYTAPLDAAGTRSALGLASANLDTQLAEIEGETDGIAAIPTTDNTANISAIKTQTDKMVFTGTGKIDASLRDWLGSVPNALTRGKVDSGTVLRTGTAQGGTQNSITLDAGASAVTNFYQNTLVLVVAGTGAGQAPVPVTTYNGTTKVADTNPFAFAVTPDNTSVFIVLGLGASSSTGFVFGNVNGDVVGDVEGRVLGNSLTGFGGVGVQADVEQWLGATAPAMTGDAFARIGVNGAGLTAIPDSATLTEIGVDVDAIQAKTDQLAFTIANQVDANALSGGGSGLDAAGVRAAVGLASANLDTQLAEIGADSDELIATVGVAGLGLTAIPTIATVTNLTNAPTNGDFTAAMKASLNAATPTPADSTTLTEIGADVDAIQAKTDQLVFTVANQVDANALTGGGGLNAAGVRAAVGLAAANLDTQLGEIATDVDGVAPIKTVTDQFRFSVANQVDANTLSGGGPTAAGIRAAVGLASANLDTQLAEIEGETDLIPTVGQIDTQLTGTHGPGAWGAAAPIGTYTITFTITDLNTAAPLADVLLTIKNQADTAIIDQQRTNQSGVAVSTLNAATYTVHVGPVAGYSTGTHTLVVAGSAGVAYTLTPFNVGTPSAMNLCRVFGYEYLNGNPIKNRSVYASLAGLPHHSSGAILDGSQATTTTDLNGYWYLDLVIGQQYRISLDEAGVGMMLTVPNQGSLDLSTLIP